MTVSKGDDSITSSGRLPVGFPLGIVRFPLGFVVGQVQDRNTGGTRSWLVLGSVDEPRSPVRAELVAFNGEPDTESGDASYPNDDPVVLTWDNHEGYALTFTLTENNDGNTVITASVKDAAP